MKKYTVLSCLVAIVFSFFLLNSKAYAFGGCEENCQKCHSLEQKEVHGILEKMEAPDVKVLDIKMSPVQGLWEVSVEDETSKLAEELEISGTPALILPDGLVVVGGREADKLKELVLNPRKKG